MLVPGLADGLHDVGVEAAAVVAVDAEPHANDSPVDFLPVDVDPPVVPVEA